MVQSFALAALAFQDQPAGVGDLRRSPCFGGLATAFDNPARRSYVVEMVPEDQVTNAVSLNSALMTGVPDHRPRARRRSWSSPSGSAGRSCSTA